MKSPTPRPYSSPLRRAQADETRERILAAFAGLVAATGDLNVGFDVLAGKAGVERRTVFRHFPSRDDLLRAFWTWINGRVTPQALPEKLADLLSLPATAFAGFDRNESVIRASLRSPVGREMRLAALPERRKKFRQSLAGELAGLSPADRRSLEAIAHLLYSAAAWEVLKDYCGLSGREAGKTVSWALQTLLRGLRSPPTKSTHPA